ncbi:hypothetical protein IV203_000728 [Nitzschia inconspicua]|uniref:Uncharacterized protein n=1 Tax=Nitzschia inconspicua TaxID=303405 RepID=A0A9K3L5W8_9STRA|nr:hypothetical protein IV203_000728 [Nitzschia inconspicua]
MRYDQPACQTIAVILLVMAGSSVEGFSVASSAAKPGRTVAALSESRHQRLIDSRKSKFPMVLSNSYSPTNSNQNPPAHTKNFMRIFIQNLLRRVPSRLGHFSFQLKRSFIVVCTAFLFCFGAFGGPTEAKASSPPTASASPTVVQVSRNFFSPSVDQIVDKYVKDHMFDDDVYDPVESVYREAMDDRIHGTYPKALKEITSSVLGQDVIKAEKSASGTSVGNTLVKMVGFLRQKGLSETQAIVLLTGGLVVGTPTVLFAILMMVGAQNKRSINRLMKKRYGETYTVDATIKEEEDVVAPDEDEDDDDEDDED